jgi:phenylalanyl-tRNA synthetase beta chain
MLVAVAKLGASVRWHGQGEPVVMEKATIRGVDSFGMICASDEIGLSERCPKAKEKSCLINMA